MKPTGTRRSPLPLAVFVVALGIGIHGLSATPSARASETVDFGSEIRPILSENCFVCHGPDGDNREAGLRLDSRSSVFGQRDGGAVVAPGDPAESELYRRITAENPEDRMPPVDSDHSLTDDQIQRIRRWIEQGAPWSEHWAFTPPERPKPPEVNRDDWSRTPIDHFILARLEAGDLSPADPADKRTLIRRVTLDLTGLPPTPQQVRQFLNDDRPGAYERLVDRLLNSPRYGERMAWPWLDAARYADTNGYQDDPERTMWPWRDRLVEALNENLPFDQFTIEQVAGDLLPDPTLDQIIASGFNRNHMYNGEGGRIPEETRVENVMDRAETTATVWMGLPLTCARCHDHKYDPITQAEYYALYDFFNQTSERGGIYGNGQVPPVVAAPTPSQQAKQQRLNERVERLAKQITATEREIDAPESPDKLAAALEKPPQNRSGDEHDRLIQHFAESQPEYAARLRELKQTLDQRRNLRQSIPKVMVMDRIDQPRQTHILTRGLYNKPTDPIEPGVPSVLPPLPADAPRNRLTLARWLVSPDHPLTARVTVNRYWQLFFGSGLVRTPEDFGVQGQPPTYPKLLDWLAVEFIESGWDVKHIHRLIVTSAAYRQRSAVSPELQQRDPDNRLLARGPRYRLPSWMIRDQALAAAGLLVGDIGGPPVKPYQPEGVWEEATFGFKTYVPDEGAKLYRRSLYTFWRRIVGPTVFFDVAKRQTCQLKPSRTNTPLHALTTLNDVTYVEAARHLARRMLRRGGDTAESRITYAFQRLTARPPKPRELEILTQRVDRLERQFRDDPSAAQKLLDVGDSEPDPSLDPVDHAAYTALCNLLLNLDETLSKQ